MVDLKASPFFLDGEQIAWVEQTIGDMTLEEKVGQLFINFTVNRDPEYIRHVCQTYHVGGIRWQGGTLEEVYEQNCLFQKESKVPVLIAANWCCKRGNFDSHAGRLRSWFVGENRLSYGTRRGTRGSGHWMQLDIRTGFRLVDELA